MNKKVVFIHNRIGERDGVSLEIEKRAKLLGELGAEVFFISGFDGSPRPRSFVIRELDIRTSFNTLLRENCFYRRVFTEDVMVFLYHQIENKIHRKLLRILLKISPDLIFTHNLFSHAYNLPATTALIGLLDHYQIPTVAVHHDFWFERLQFRSPKYHFIEDVVGSLPPNRSYITHQVINSLAAEELKSRRQISAGQIGDYFDFQTPPPVIDDYNRDLLKHFGIGGDDLVILHATRIIPRKAIENAFRFATLLERELKRRSPLHLNTKVFTRSSRVVVLLPNFIEVDARAYFKKLKLLAEKLSIRVIWADDKFSPRRKIQEGVKRYDFFNSYAFADLVTFTSTWEGFGNQFLEAVFYKKLCVLFEYPVFTKDLKREGYRYISLGSEFRRVNGFQFVPRDRLVEASKETIGALTHPAELAEILESNYQKARQYHDLSTLRTDLNKLLH